MTVTVVMKVDSNSPIRPGTTRAARRSSGTGGAFARELEGGPQSKPGVSGSGPVSALAALLAAQAVPDPADGRRQAMKRGNRLLDLLEDLRIALIDGNVSRVVLDEVAAWLEHRDTELDDPELAELIAQIELRAAVELAKLETVDRER